MAESKFTFEEQVTLWSQFARSKLAKAIRKNKIGHSGALENSISEELQSNGGDVFKAIFKFLQYGRYVDIGTGRGFARGARGTAAFALHRNDNGTLKAQVNRHPKPWYSKTMYREIKILQEKLLANTEAKVMDTIQARIRRINSHSSNASS